MQMILSSASALLNHASTSAKKPNPAALLLAAEPSARAPLGRPGPICESRDTPQLPVQVVVRSKGNQPRSRTRADTSSPLHSALTACRKGDEFSKRPSPSFFICVFH